MTKTFCVPRGSAELELHLRSSGDDAVWFDDVRVEVAGSNVPGCEMARLDGTPTFD